MGLIAICPWNPLAGIIQSMDNVQKRLENLEARARFNLQNKPESREARERRIWLDDLKNWLRAWLRISKRLLPEDLEKFLSLQTMDEKRRLVISHGGSWDSLANEVFLRLESREGHPRIEKFRFPKVFHSKVIEYFNGEHGAGWAYWKQCSCRQPIVARDGIHGKEGQAGRWQGKLIALRECPECGERWGEKHHYLYADVFTLSEPQEGCRCYSCQGMRKEQGT